MTHFVFLGGFIAHVVLAVTASFLPLLDGLGFERSLATGLLAAATSGALGIEAGFRKDSRPMEAVGWAILLGLVQILPSLLMGWFVETFIATCDEGEGAAFFLLLSAGNVLICTAFGIVAVWWTQRASRAVLIYIGLHVVFLGLAVAKFYTEPQVFVYVYSLGFWPGPIYDEALAVAPHHWAFRAVGLGIATFLLFASRLILFPSRNTWVWVLGSLASLGGGYWAYAEGGPLGFGRDRAAVEAALSQKVETPHFVLHFDPRFNDEDVEAITFEHQLAHARLTEWFGQSPTERVHSYIYHSQNQKGQLMGAARTQVAKPWLNEIHIHGASVPHRVLDHELAHVFAGVFSRGFLRVPAAFGIFPKMGLIEGVAVAAEVRLRELELHGWAAAQDREKVLPPIAKLLSPFGFYGLSSARAYSAAGSFVRWLVETKGITPLIQVYGGASFMDAYGISLPELEQQWQTFLRKIELTPSEMRAARHRFARPSIWQKVCARRAARDTETGYARLRVGDLDGARPLLERLQAEQPARIRPILDLAAHALRKGQMERAEAWILRAESAEGPTEASRSAATELRGHLAWARGDLVAAAEAYANVRGLEVSTASIRLQDVRLYALRLEPDAREVLRRYLNGGLTGDAALYELIRVANADREDPVLAYLVARRLEAGLPERAIERLEPRWSDLPTPALRDEAALVLGRSAYRSENYEKAIRWFAQTSTSADRVLPRALAEDWLGRAQMRLERAGQE